MTDTNTPARRILRTLSDLRACSSGIAITEFALTLPLYFGVGAIGLETASYVAANMTISQAALMVADNAGRVRKSIDETDIEEVMVGARTAGEGVRLGYQGRVILSSLEPNGLTGTSAGQMIRWQRCFGLKGVSSSYGTENQGKTDNSLAAGMGPTGNKIKALSGSAVMFVEVKYDYEPMFFDDYLSNKTMQYTAAYTVRERATHTMTNLSNMGASAKRLCSRYSAT